MHRSSQVLPALILGLAMNATLADEPTPPANCINTEVNGYQALSYECLSQQMADPDSAARARREQELDSAAIVRRPPNQLGLYNQSATRIRLAKGLRRSASWPAAQDRKPRQPGRGNRRRRGWPPIKGQGTPLRRRYAPAGRRND